MKTLIGRSIGILGFLPCYLGLLALTSVGSIGVALAQTQAQTTGQIAQQVAQRQAPVQLVLVGEKQMLQRDDQGKEKVTWQAFNQQAAVRPGDVIRYTLNSKNTSDRPVKNLVVTQPVPQRTIFILNSVAATQGNGIAVVYSIDGGKSFVAKPTVPVKLPDGKTVNQPAPAQAYTHIRWTFDQAIPAKTTVSVTYQVRVR